MGGVLTCALPPLIVIVVETWGELDAGWVFISRSDEAGTRRAIIQHGATCVTMETHAQMTTHLWRHVYVHLQQGAAVVGQSVIAVLLETFDCVVWKKRESQGLIAQLSRFVVNKWFTSIWNFLRDIGDKSRALIGWKIYRVTFFLKKSHSWWNFVKPRKFFCPQSLTKWCTLTLSTFHKITFHKWSYFIHYFVRFTKLSEKAPFHSEKLHWVQLVLS